ncbi:hypothetical protein AGMMS50229_06150 [Campylobacterota bacterium]|nr:hypothetical protein AGMMS50229_06150 [Campylobacterota bacterium]
MSEFFDRITAADPSEAFAALADRYAKNERFFAGGALGKFFGKNSRLKLQLLDRAIVITQGDRVLQNWQSIASEAVAISQNPFANPRYELVPIASLAAVEAKNLPITTSGVNEIVQLASGDRDFVAESINFDRTSPLPPTIFYGTGAGLGFDLLSDRLDGAAIIYENDPDWFLISCHFVDYERFLTPKRALIVSGKIEPNLVREFLFANLLTNSFARFEVRLSDHPLMADAAQAIENAHREMLRGWGSFEDEMVGIRNAIANQRERFFVRPAKTKTAIAVVGNGASLNGLFGFLRSNCDRLVIFSSGTALKPLRTAGIRPDFQIEIERRDHLSEILSAAPIEDIALIGAMTLDRSSLEAAEKRLLFVRDSSAAAKLFDSGAIVRFSSPIVGNAALALALEFSDEIYLCGLDVGFKKGKRQHADNSFYDATDDVSSDAMPTRGNFSGEIYTNPLLFHSKTVLEMAIAAHPEARVFNLSDGAFVRGAKPLRAEEAAIALAGDKDEATQLIESAFDRTGAGTGRNGAADFATQAAACAEFLIAAMKQFEPHNRTETFRAFDALFAASFEAERRYPVAGTAIRGSFWHLAHSLIKGIMAVKRSDTSDLYALGTEAIAKALREFGSLSF